MAALEHPTVARGSADSVPVIDVGSYLGGAPGALDRVAGEIRHALENIGFFVIVNHDVPRDLVARALFLEPHVDTLTECLPTCVAPGGEARLPPITYGGYLDWWYTENYPPGRQDDA